MHTAATLTGLPIRPSSTYLRTVCQPPPRNVSGAVPNSSPLDFARSMSSRASAIVTVIIFSTATCLPARSASRLTSKCASGKVRFMTISMLGSS